MNDIQRLRLPEDDPVFGGNKVFDLFKYSPAVCTNGLIFVAGQVGIRPDGTIPETAAEQTRLVFQRLAAILAHEGAGFQDLIELVSYHVAIDQHLDAFRAVKDDLITSDFPTWTAVGVQALARSTILVEVKAVAVARQKAVRPET